MLRKTCTRKKKSSMYEKKLLMTASTFSHIYNFHLPYIREFKELGWEVHIACGGVYREIPYADKQIQLPFEKRYLSMANFKAYALLRQLLRENNYRLVITHTALASFFTRFAEKGIKPHPKTINVVHGYLFDDNTNAIKSILLKSAEFLTLPETDMILTMNRFDHQWATKTFPSKPVQYIPGMGVDEQKLKKTGDIAAKNSEDFLLVYPAEFSRRKNQAMLIRAMPLLPESVKLLLPGEGTLLGACKALVRKLNVDKRVFFPGYVSNMGTVFSMADAAVSASRSEGLPFNIIEAMLSGLPVIASDVKGNSDLVRHGVTGYLFPYNDEKAFAGAVKELVEHRELIETMGQSGRSDADQFRIQQVLPEVMKAYLSFETL